MRLLMSLHQLTAGAHTLQVVQKSRVQRQLSVEKDADSISTNVKVCWERIPYQGTHGVLKCRASLL